MDQEPLIGLAADIVSAHVSHNTIDAKDLPELILSVYGALRGAEQGATSAQPKPEPAVSIRASVKQHALICLECGQQMKMLKRHLNTHHHLSPSDYRTRWSLPSDYPMTAPEYGQRRRELALQFGLGHKPAKRQVRRKMAVR